MGSESSLLPVLLFPLDLERLESWECAGCEGSKRSVMSLRVRPSLQPPFSTKSYP